MMEREEKKMKKRLVALLLICMVVFTACSGGGESATSYTEVNVTEGITLTLNEDTLKKAKATFTLTNNTQEAAKYSTYEYHFEKMKDGQWNEFTGTAKTAWGDDRSLLEAGEAVELVYDWKMLCGTTLTDEQYRLIILVNESPVAVEFIGK